MINVDEIMKIEKQRRQVKKEIYMKIYEQFTRKIRQCVELNQKQVFLRTPSYIMGYPTFDRGKATDYLKRQLENGKFDVTKASNIDLYVSWKKPRDSTEKIKRKEPEMSFQDDDMGFPTLINLKKAADKYRVN